MSASVVPVDINLAPPQATSSGCDGAFAEAAVGAPLVADPGGPDDFAGFPAGGIALIQRGTCSFALKAYNAQAAGASAVIIFNQGNTPERSGLIVGNATAPPPAPGPLSIPVVGASFADGSALAQVGSTALVDVDPPESRPQVNVIAELPGTNNANVVMAGAHLDSVQAGPGINDNGSGSACVVGVGRAARQPHPAEHAASRLVGRRGEWPAGVEAYVASLSQAEKDRIALYLNFDMVGSPNYIFMVYDGDTSSFPAPPGIPIPAGSVQIEDTFESFYTLSGEPYDDTQFSGRSDYQAFILNDIPAGGLFTGAEVVKTAEQQSIWGGTTGAQFDPCYHLACDTFDNVDLHALEVNADAVAFGVLTYAYSTETVNGVAGRRCRATSRFPHRQARRGPSSPEPTWFHDREGRPATASPPRVIGLPSTYAGVGGPNQVVSASGSPGSVRSPTQATCPSGRINTAGGAVTSPSTGSSHTPAYAASTSCTRAAHGVMSKPPGSPRLSSTGRASCSRVNTRRGPSAVTRSRSGMRRPSSGCPSPRS